uniref:MICOS complex subunit n=1 Tax=Heterorhabditis bacteriophora TaxID=37862 RepID=A0A1I7XRJ3_HETBA
MTTPSVSTTSSEHSQKWSRWAWWARSPVLSQTSTCITPEANKSINSLQLKHEAIDPIHSNLGETLSVWNKFKEIYERPTMERETVVRAARMAFFGGFLVGGASGYTQAKHFYELNNASRKYLSASDAFKRRTDYVCLFISFPQMSRYIFIALVGGVFALPLGMVGSCKAFGFGFSSGLTLSAVAYLYALTIDKSVDDAYWVFKKNYDKELLATEEWERRLTELMEAEHIFWRQSAIQRLKKIDEENLASNDT